MFQNERLSVCRSVGMIALVPALPRRCLVGFSDARCSAAVGSLAVLARYAGGYSVRTSSRLDIHLRIRRSSCVFHRRSCATARAPEPVRCIPEGRTKAGGRVNSSSSPSLSSSSTSSLRSKMIMITALPVVAVAFFAHIVQREATTPKNSLPNGFQRIVHSIRPECVRRSMVNTCPVIQDQGEEFPPVENPEPYRIEGFSI